METLCFHWLSVTLPTQGKLTGWKAPHFIADTWREKPKLPGASLTSEGGVLISLGWRWEDRLTDKALGAASSLLGDGRRHNPLILLC